MSHYNDQIRLVKFNKIVFYNISLKCAGQGVSRSLKILYELKITKKKIVLTNQ